MNLRRDAIFSCDVLCNRAAALQDERQTRLRRQFNHGSAGECAFAGGWRRLGTGVEVVSLWGDAVSQC